MGAAPGPAGDASGLLDLSQPLPSDSGPTSDRRPAPASRTPTAPSVRRGRRVTSDSITRLDHRAPAVTLTRFQSGTGTLVLRLTRSTSSGDLALGAAVHTARGLEGAVQAAGGATELPAGAPHPLTRLIHLGDDEAVVIDLRQVRLLERALLYAYSPTGAEVAFDGVLVATTFGAARVEIPFDIAPFVGSLAIATLYNVHGELVLRSEREPLLGPPEAITSAYGFHIPWLDGRIPAT